MKSGFAGKTILVTGGTGSIGSEIVKYLLANKDTKVVVFSRDEIKHFLMRSRLRNNNLFTIVGDVRDINSIERVFSRFNVDMIFHAAAMKHIVMCENFPMEAVETNVFGTQNLVDLAIKYRIPKMITISTDKAASPINILGATKLIAERITLNGTGNSNNNLKFSCVRFGNVAASRGSVIPVLIDNLIYGKPLQITDVNVTRFIMEIPNAVKLIIEASNKTTGGDIFILKMRAFKLEDLLDVIIKRIAPKLNIEEKDIKIEMSGLINGEKLHEELVFESERNRLYEINDMYVVLPDNISFDKYSDIKKVNLGTYSSRDARLFSKNELEDIVLKYLQVRSTNPI
jgi:UDP-N-acetylglucosamine 4,6-dehydratase/5-epimerase